MELYSHVFYTLLSIASWQAIVRYNTIPSILSDVYPEKSIVTQLKLPPDTDATTTRYRHTYFMM